MCSQTNFKSAVGGIVNENSFAGLDEEEKLVAIHESCPKSVANSKLSCKFPVKVHSCFERIVRRRNVMREHGGSELGVAPIVITESVRQTLAVESDLPGKHTKLLERAAIEFRDCFVVLARESRKWESAIVVERNEIRGARVFKRDHALRRCLLKIGHVLNQELAIGLKKRLHFFRQSVHRLICHQTIRVFAPAERSGQPENQDEHQERQEQRREKAKPHYCFFSAAACRAAFESWLCL